MGSSGGGIAGGFLGSSVGQIGGLPGQLIGANKGYNLGSGAFGGQGGGQGYAPPPPPPTRPEFNSLIDPSTGLLKSQYQTQWGPDVTADQRGINAYRDMALGTGPSPWAQAQLGAQKLEEQGLKNSTLAQGASAGAQARSALASKSGLSPAAAARLATQNMRGQQSGLQNVGFQGAQSRAGIGAQDAASRQQFLAGLPGQDLAQANLAFQNKTGNLSNQQYNINNAVNQNAQKNAADLAAYTEQTKLYGADRSADAIRQAGGGGGKGK